MQDLRFSEMDASKRDIPSFIEPRPPLISNPFMRPRPQKGTNLLELFEEDSEYEEPDTVQVYLRLKPCNEPSNFYEVRSERNLITSLDKATAGHGRRTQTSVSKMYTFSHIFEADSTQKEVFDTVVKDNLKKLPDGHSFTLLTYGASGSGKTYSLMGTVQSPGLVPRSLEYLFKIVDASQYPLFKPVDGNAEQLSYVEQEYELKWVKRLQQLSAPLRDKYRRMSVQLVNDLTQSTFDLSSRIKHYVWVSFIEIYNEGIYDLLVAGDRRASSTLRIREDADGKVFVKGATQAFVRSGSEAYDILVAGKHNLQVAATGIHARSSRSHCIFTITLLTETESGVRSSCVRLCDLAGCERAVKTRNTGARLAESKHINSSLHVLERCLHMLRRKGRSHAQLVPYRESKLTRLLGSGLSGGAGEAVAMLVSVHPADSRAAETRHVLALAAVARDIQINNTVVETSLEFSSSNNTTITSSAEVMKLRSENERLHFELLQSQARHKELISSMELRQQENATTMQELVEDAKDMMRQYYEPKIQELQTEMEEMIEEYESRLNKLDKPLTETPNRLQNRVAQLLTEIEILEEKLHTEKLARARAEEEVQHLRACIDERDEKSEEEDPVTIDEGVTSLTESEDESDVYNESLEPTFKMEDINKSRQILRQSLLSNMNNTNRTNQTIHESIMECSNDTIKDNDDTFNATNNQDVEKSINKDNLTASIDESGYDLAKESEIHYKTVSDDTEVVLSGNNTEPRGTYFVRKSEDSSSDDSYTSIEAVPTTVKKANVSRGTYYVSNKENSNDTGVETLKDKEDEDKKPDAKYKPSILQNNNTKTKKEERSESFDNSLMQFEKLEEAAKTPKDETKVKEDLVSVKVLKHKNFLFDETTCINKNENATKSIAAQSNNCSEISDLVNSVKKAEAKNKPDLNVVKSNKTNDVSNKEENKDTKKIYFDNLTNVNDPIDNQLINKGKDLQPCKAVQMAEISKDITPKKTLFTDERLINVSRVLESIGKKTYFDDLDKNKDTNKSTRLNEVKQTLNDDRSPSIVKDEVTGKVELSTIKKLLGESFTRQTDANTVGKSVTKPKKQDSMDLFDSPLVKVNDAIDEVRKSINDLNINKVEKVHETKTIPEIRINSVELETSKIDQREISMNSTKGNNTVEDFENLYKDITAPRATEFELLVSEVNDPNSTVDKEFKEPLTKDTKYNLRKTNAKMDKEEIKTVKEPETIEPTVTETKKYKLRNFQTDDFEYETQTKPSKRNLRLRRRKNQEDDSSDISQDTSKAEESSTATKSKAKLKDIVNLQSEFSDVTMDVPAPHKEMKDIPSPEKNGDENENVPPNGTQSCPSKSVTRSRRKLFTPRPEPLEESPPTSGERVKVPRPSYRGPRARRRL